MPVDSYNGPNLVLKYDKEKKRLVNIAVDNRSSPFYALRDRHGNAIGVTACDIDGDGREEIYVLNTNNAFSGTVQSVTAMLSLKKNPKNTALTQGLYLFAVQRQSRSISKQILSLSHLSPRQITDKLCAAINQPESRRARAARTATPPLHHLYKK